MLKGSPIKSVCVAMIFCMLIETYVVEITLKHSKSIGLPMDLEMLKCTHYTFRFRYAQTAGTFTPTGEARMIDLGDFILCRMPSCARKS
jgi:hypothetical protein